MLYQKLLQNYIKKTSSQRKSMKTKSREYISNVYYNKKYI